jgi:hypothetical protein
VVKVLRGEGWQTAQSFAWILDTSVTLWHVPQSTHTAVP